MEYGEIGYWRPLPDGKLDHDEHIHGSADVEAGGLEEAVDLALEMLKAQYFPKCEFIEIWQGDQRLYPPTGGESHGTDAA